MSCSRSAWTLAIVGLACVTHPAFGAWGNDLDGGVAMPSYGPLVTCAVDFAGDLVVGGRFDHAGNIAVTNVARWNGSGWSALGSELVAASQHSIPVSDLVVHDQGLYATGAFHTDIGAPANGAARWNGVAWVALADVISPDLDHTADVTCVISFTGDLWIGGDMSDIQGADKFARWAGGGWEFIPSPFIGPTGCIRDMAVLDDRIWAVGCTHDGHEIIANWDGGSWTTILDDSQAGQVKTICAHQGSIYVGGSFTSLDGNSIDLLARWTGSVWEPGTSGTLENGFWFWNGPEPSWVGCGVHTLLSVGDRLFAGGLLSGSSAGELYGKMSVALDGSVEQVGGALGERVSFGVLWPIVNALAYVQDQVIIGGDFNEGDGIDHPLGCLIGLQPEVATVGPVPSAAMLRAPTPNPFNPQTVLSFQLADAGPCRLEIFDLRGRLIRSLCAGIRSGGEHRFAWNGCDDRGEAVGSGAYVARLTTADGRQTRKLMLAR